VTVVGAHERLRPIAVVDGLLAATAKAHGLTLASRNDADVAGIGAKVLNPFKLDSDGSETA
jgi:predicted nucleic acid-binding protein